MAEVTYERRTSFNAGEISAWLDSRIDQEKYHSGCRQIQNMKPTIYGGCFRRPGSVYLGAAASGSGVVRLIGFEFSATTSYVLELGANTLRIWTTGASPALIQDPDSPGNALVVATPWAANELNELQFAQQNDILFVVHPNHRPRCICRYESNDWRVVRYNPDWPALLPINDRNITIQCTAANATPAAWSNSTTYDAGDEVTHEGEDYACRLDDCKKIEPGDHKNWRRWWKAKDGTTTLGIGRRVTVSASKSIFQSGHVGTKWVLIWRRDELKKTLHLNGGSVGKTTGSIYCLGEWSAGLFADNSGSGDWDVEVTVQISENNKTWKTRKVISGSITEVQSLLTGNEPEPCFLRLKLTTRNGTIPTQYKAELEVANPDQHGIVRIKSVTNGTTATGTLEFPVPNSDTTKYWHEPAWSGVRGNPRAVCMHEGRLWFGGTNHQPTTFWATGPDRYEDFRTGAEADRGLEFTILSDEANVIRWMASQDALVIGTSGGEWFYGQRIGEDLPKIRKNTNYGSAAIQARVGNDSIVFVQRSKRKLREFAWSSEREGFSVPDLTLLAEHFGDAQFAQITIQRNPETVVWLTTTRGELIGMVYERTQNVVAWFRYVTDGVYNSVCAVEGTGEEDELWVAVTRTINGSSVRYIERFQPDLIRETKESDQDSLIFVDSAKVRTGSATTTITGLSHLEGESVSILADGAPHPNRTVASGQITLQWEASKVIVGLPFTSLLEPTYLETSDPSSITKAFLKRILRADIEFWKSLGAEISSNNGETWHPIEFRGPEDYMDEVPPLFSGIKQELVESSSGKQASIILRQAQPLPMNVLSLVIRFTIGTA